MTNNTSCNRGSVTKAVNTSTVVFYFCILLLFCLLPLHSESSYRFNWSNFHSINTIMYYSILIYTLIILISILYYFFSFLFTRNNWFGIIIEIILLKPLNAAEGEYFSIIYLDSIFSLLKIFQKFLIDFEKVFLIYFLLIRASLSRSLDLELCSFLPTAGVMHTFC